MKVALVHDYLNQYGGAERVLETLIEMFPDAPVYTLLYDKDKTLGRFEGKIAGTSFLDSRFVRNHHRMFLPLMPSAIRAMDLGSEYDVIISDTAGYGKGISYDPKTTKHISYCHTPLRYAWETGEYTKMKFGNVLGMIATTAVNPVAWYLRRWDHRIGQKPDVMLANSQFIADKIKRYYGREAAVVYPPVDTKTFYYDPNIQKQGYYLALGRFLHYKRFDLIIDAFKKNGLSLRVIGSGPDEDVLRLRARGAANITFEPFITSESALRTIYNEAKAVIFPHTEDFGLVAAEAQACGTPVIAYADGGALEIVGQKTGVLFEEQSPEALLAAVRQCDEMHFDRKHISGTAERFSKEHFLSAMRRIVSR